MSTTVSPGYRVIVSLVFLLGACSSIELASRTQCRELGTTDNCGACGDSCAVGQLCSNNLCKCPLGQELCGNRCVPNGSESNCSAACASDADCLDPNDANAVCNSYQCNTDTGLCEASPLTDFDLPATEQVTGDCHTQRCSGGVIVSVSSTDDAGDDGEDCTYDLCSQGEVSNPPRPANTPCTSNSDGLATLCDSTGQCVQCNKPSDCDWLPPDDECQQRSCINHQCGQVFTPANNPISTQTAGDCKRTVCDGSGGTQQNVLDTDLPFDGNQCTDAQCDNGVPSNPPRPANTLCADSIDPSASLCDGSGQCVQCNEPVHCDWLPTDDECQQRSCINHQCGQVFTPVDTPVLTQINGDCQLTVCDGIGGTKQNVLDSDLPADGNQCTANVCNNGVPSNPAKAIGMLCSAGVCNGDAVNPACVGCNVPTDCGADSADGCLIYACNNNVCGTDNPAAGTSLANNLQTAGNCQKLQCDGSGGVQTVANPTDLPADDGNACTQEVCSGTMASHPAFPIDTNCGGGMYCNGASSCVACNFDAQCSGATVCSSAQCSANQCTIVNDAAGTPAPSPYQTAADCKATVCDGAGALATAPAIDDSDVPDDNNECTLDICTMGVPSHPAAPDGTACSDGSCVDGSCTPSWTVVHPKATVEDMQAVHFVDASHGWAVGEKGTILHTSNGGKKWVSQTSDVSTTLRDITFIDTTVGWAVGDNGIILHSNDGGNTWSPQTSGTSFALTAVQFVDASQGWIVGNGGKILMSTDGGANWTAQSSGVLEPLNDLHFHDANIGWVVGDGGTIRRTSNGGTSWADGQITNTIEDLKSVSFVSNSLGWAVGANGTVMHTTDGQNWSPQTSDSDALLYAVKFANAMQGWAAGAGGVILETSDGGSSWDPQTSGTFRDLYDLHFLDAQQGYVAGDVGGLRTTQNGGLDWVGQGSVSKNSTGFTQAHFIDANTGWAIDRDGELSRTTDGGAGWSVSTLQYFSNVASENSGFVHLIDGSLGVAGDSSGYTAQSIDGGGNWQTTTGQPRMGDVDFINQSNGWGVGDSGSVGHTTTAGSTWTSIDLGTNVDLYGIDFADANLGVIVGGYFTTGGQIWRTTNGGANWVALGSASSAILRAVSFADSTVGVAVGESGTVLWTSDGGENWNDPVDASVIGSTSLEDVCLSPGGTGWAVGYKYIFKTTDGGQSWTKQEPSTQESLYTVNCIDANTAYVTGRNALVLKTVDGGGS